MALFRKRSARSISAAENQVCICGSRPKVTIEDLKEERNFLRESKLQYMKECDLCDEACKSISANYRRAQRRRSAPSNMDEKSSGHQDAIAQPERERSTRSILAVNIITPLSHHGSSPKGKGLLYRQLTALPGLTENNQRVQSRRHYNGNSFSTSQASKKSSGESHLPSIDTRRASSDRLVQDASPTLTVPTTVNAKSSISTQNRSSRSTSLSSSATLSSLTSTPTQSTTSTFPTLTLPPPALNPTQPIVFRSHTEISFKAYHLARNESDLLKRRNHQNLSFWDLVKAAYAEHMKVRIRKKDSGVHKQILMNEIRELRRDVGGWERRCERRRRALVGVRERCGCGEGMVYHGTADEVEVEDVGRDEGRVEVGAEGNNGFINKTEKGGEEKKKWRACGLDFLELLPSRRLREKLGRWSLEK